MADKDIDTNHAIIGKVLREFSWGNYGLDDVEIGLADYPDDQEWVTDLADEIWHALLLKERLT